VWELSSGRELRTLRGHTGSVYAMALTADGQLAVSASDDKTLRVWELSSGRELRTLRGHSGYVTAVAVTAGGRLAISVSEDKTLRAWELGSGGELAAFTADAPLKCCAISVDGKTIVAGDESGVVHYLRLELAQSKSNTSINN
jgi:WD40 repeat protein